MKFQWLIKEQLKKNYNFFLKTYFKNVRKN
jgi:hypothetical protein